MTNKLEIILRQKKREVADLYHSLAEDHNHPIAGILQGNLKCNAVPSFISTLASQPLSVIAEIKRQSPSKGLISPITDPIQLTQNYIAGGASALSILTDQTFFGGSMNDLLQVKNALENQSIPILRKDFIIDKIQIAEAALAGASAVLCVIAAVGYHAKALIEFSHSLGLDVLVEIHNNEELNIALDCGSNIIGVNNRNLTTFEIDTNTAFSLVKNIPNSIIKVAESGIHHPRLAREYHQAGFHAVLIGEALVKADHPEKFIEACHHEPSY